MLDSEFHVEMVTLVLAALDVDDTGIAGLK